MAADDVRRARILDTAERLFSQYGVRRTSMDLLATEAGVAKPTLYAYFGSKEELFRSVVQALINAIIDDAEAVAASSLPLDAKMRGILEAKFTRMYELVFSSAHAAELLESSDSQARDIAAEGDQHFRRILTDVLLAAQSARDLDLGRIGASTEELVDALMVAGHGASWNADSAADHRRNIAGQVRFLLAGVSRPLSPGSVAAS